MKIEEWKKQASKEAVEQYEKPVEWFKNNVKCCNNCKHWEVDPTLMYEYAYNTCELIGCKDGKLTMTVFDGVCDNYQGNATIENLLDYVWMKRKEA